MEEYIIREPITIMYVTAATFPDGVQSAFDQLEKSVPDFADRTLYGFSDMNHKGEIVYRAAIAEDHNGEAAELGLNSFTITPGEYKSETIMDWYNHKEQIGEAFQRLMKEPRMDLTFPCLELYKNDDEMMCLVRLNEKKK